MLHRNAGKVSLLSLTAHYNVQLMIAIVTRTHPGDEVSLALCCFDGFENY